MLQDRKIDQGIETLEDSLIDDEVLQKMQELHALSGQLDSLQLGEVLHLATLPASTAPEFRQHGWQQGEKDSMHSSCCSHVAPQGCVRKRCEPHKTRRSMYGSVLTTRGGGVRQLAK